MNDSSLDELIRLEKNGSKFLLGERPKEAVPKCKTLDTQKAVQTENGDQDRPKRTKVDTGKIKALAKAGWKTKDIAGELGITEASVSGILYRDKKKEEDKEEWK